MRGLSHFHLQTPEARVSRAEFFVNIFMFLNVFKYFLMFFKFFHAFSCSFRVSPAKRCKKSTRGKLRKDNDTAVKKRDCTVYDCDRRKLEATIQNKAATVLYAMATLLYKKLRRRLYCIRRRLCCIRLRLYCIKRRLVNIK